METNKSQSLIKRNLLPNASLAYSSCNQMVLPSLHLLAIGPYLLHFKAHYIIQTMLSYLSGVG